MQLEQPPTSYALHRSPPSQPYSWSNLSPAVPCSCHHHYKQAAGATAYQLCTAQVTISKAMQLEQTLTSDVLHRSPTSQPTMQLKQHITSSVMLKSLSAQSCSWNNLSPALQCRSHPYYKHAAGATSHQLCNAQVAISTIMQLTQPIISSVMLKSPSAQPCSWSNCLPALYCSSNHQQSHAAGATSHQLCTAQITNITTIQLEQPLASCASLVPPPPQLSS